jgi:hypothetical protein
VVLLQLPCPRLRPAFSQRERCKIAVAFGEFTATLVALMKKTFPLTHPKKKPERLVDAIRSEVNKYLKRERKKTLPDGADYWDFDCKVGLDAESAPVVHVSALSKAIGDTLEAGGDTCYLEILSKPGKRLKIPASAG